MPVVLLERLPLPSLRTYTGLSAALLACAVYYGHQVIIETEAAKQNKTTGTVSEDAVNITGSPPDVEEDGYPVALIDAMLQEAWCIWTLINTAYCCLILLGKMIQRAVFGELRVSEQQHIKDKFWNFVFYKFIFIFGVMNVQNMDEVVAWCAWFSILGFLHLLSQLSKDRFEYLSFSPTTPAWMHAKVLLLLLGIQGACFCLIGVCLFVGMQAGINTFAFMIAECALLGIKTMYVLVRYAIHLWDLHHEGVWENRAIYVYYSEFVFEMSSLTVDFSHHLHMLLWGNIFLSMASLVICMQLRYLFHEFQRRVKRHKNYRRVVNSMEARFPMATPEDIEKNSDDCAICWDKMENARKLPCGHLFHNSCLRSWLEQDTSCPTCRTSLSDPQEHDVNANAPGPGGDAHTPPAPQPQPVNQQISNHFFHFDGSRYVSWLPSFSVEVTHTHILGNGPPPSTAAVTSQLDNMARQVQGVFQHMPINTIIEDLRVTRSVELTIENILEGRLVPPPNFSSRSSQNTGSDSSEASQGTSDEDSQPSSMSSVPENEESTDLMELSQATNLNFIQDENIPDLSSEDDESDQSLDDCATTSGSRFSKSPSERETMLANRKEDLLEQARRRYLAKQMDMDPSPDDDNVVLTPSPSSSSSSWPSQSREGLEFHGTEPSHDALSQQLLGSPFDLLQHDMAQASPDWPELEEDNNDRQRRRELAYRAAQRRLNLN